MEEDGKILAIEKDSFADADEEIKNNNQTNETKQNVKINDEKQEKNSANIIININIDATVEQLDDLSERIKHLLSSINE